MRQFYYVQQLTTKVGQWNKTYIQFRYKVGMGKQFLDGLNAMSVKATPS